MKILGYSLANGMIRVLTDNPGREEFVYPADRFDSMEALENEINKSISQEASRKAAKDSKVSKVTSAIDAKVKV